MELFAYKQKLPLSLLFNQMVKLMKTKKKDEAASEKILEAARKVFLTKGLDGARMQDIADEAGMNKALLHYYYSNKEKLFEMIFMEEAKKFFPKIKSCWRLSEAKKMRYRLFILYAGLVL